MLILFTAVGSAIGGIVRYLVMIRVDRLCGEGFPWGTLTVNAIGSLILGCVLGAMSIAPGDSGLSAEWANAFFAIGFCGGLTTFSTFSLQTLSLVSKQQQIRVAANIIGSLSLCVGCIILGYTIIERLAT